MGNLTVIKAEDSPKFYGKKPLILDIVFSKFYCERIEWIMEYAKNISENLNQAIVYQNENLTEPVEIMPDKFNPHKIGFTVAMFGKPQINWDFDSLQSTIDMIYAFALTEENRILNRCSYCHKPFFAKNTREKYCTPSCRNCANVIKSRNKKKALKNQDMVNTQKNDDIKTLNNQCEEKICLDDTELDSKLERISVYARVSPENKIRIVKAWQKKGKVTAMTGDGVNDAPALKQADIGIGMGSGTEVAKDASAMVLVDDNFATIVNAIEVGRTVYSNIKKSITYLFSGNLGGIISILFAVFAGWANPFTTIQLLFINLVTDSLPAIALGFEKPEKNTMNKPPRDPNESILCKDTLKVVLTRGSIIGIVTILAQYIGMQTSDALGAAMAFSTITLSRIIQTFAARSNSETICSLGFTSNKYALGAVIVCLAMFSTTLLPFMRGIFAIPSVFEIQNLAICFGLAVLATICMEISKLFKR